MEKLDKLIELLNEWERERVNHNTKEYIKRGKSSFTRLGIIEVISKSYGFIKWLVENDKIDMRKAKYYSDSIYYQDYGEGDWACKDYEFVIMLLAISDTPIDDLISYLK